MSQPPPYNRSTSFSNFQARNPTTPPSGTDLDIEFNNVKATLDAILFNLKRIQRDDTALANASVGRAQLSSDLTLGFSTPTPWQTGTQYTNSPASTVFIDGKFYACAISHVSGVFATDLAAGNWTLIADFSSGGFTSPAAWQSGVNYTSSPASIVFINGAFYICQISHTSGVFSTDLAHGDWTLLSDFNGVSSLTVAGPITGQTVAAQQFLLGPQNGLLAPASDTSGLSLAVGPNALNGQTIASDPAGYRNIAIGYWTLNAPLTTAAKDNVAIGYLSQFTNNSGFSNVALGSNTLQSNTSGFENTAVGGLCLQSNTTGQDNVALGQEALFLNTTGSFNMALGVSCLEHNTTGSHNTAAGFRALVFNTTASFNSAFGESALDTNTTGDHLAAFGYQALFGNTTGVKNTAVGAFALQNVTTGNSNTAIGEGAGVGITTGSNNTIIGASAGALLPPGLSNNIILSDGAGNIRLQFDSSGNASFANAAKSSGQGGVGYATGAGGTVTQTGSRTTGVTLNKIAGQITLVSAAGSATPQVFTVTNSTVAATDTVVAAVKAGTTDTYSVVATAVAAGSFKIAVTDLTGTTNEQPVINFTVIKGANA